MLYNFVSVEPEGFINLKSGSPCLLSKKKYLLAHNWWWITPSWLGHRPSVVEQFKNIM
jgi:hypothetical protein